MAARAANLCMSQRKFLKVPWGGDRIPRCGGENERGSNGAIQTLGQDDVVYPPNHIAGSGLP